MNLRGIRESGTAFAIPTYAFIFGIVIMIGWGLFRIYVLGDAAARRAAQLRRCRPSTRLTAGFALVFLLRAGVLLRAAPR